MIRGLRDRALERLPDHVEADGVAYVFLVDLAAERAAYRRAVRIEGKHYGVKVRTPAYQICDAPKQSSFVAFGAHAVETHSLRQAVD